MKKNIFILSLLALFMLDASAILSKTGADDTKKGINPDDKKGEEIVKYKPKIIYHQNAYRLYKLTETTNIHRLYSDSTTKDFKRVVTYFTTITIETAPENGFQSLSVVIDSMYYKMTEGDKVIEFNSQADQQKRIRFDDLEATSVPLNRQFKMTYSPYGEVAKIESPDIDEMKDFMKNSTSRINMDKSTDEMTMFIWNEGLSDSRLKHITDLKKINLPDIPMAKDSVWKSPFTIQIDGKDFVDTVNSRIVEYNNGKYVIESKTNNMKPVKKDSYFYSVKKPATIESAKADGFYIIQINPNGIVSKVEAEFNAQSNCKVRFEPFYEQVNSKMVWEYMGQYKL